PSLAAPPQAAQTPPPAATFTTGAELVQVPVVVTDATHRPLAGLTASDFTLRQDGKDQKIATFEEINVGPRSGNAQPQQGEYSNFGRQVSAARGLTIIVID